MDKETYTVTHARTHTLYHIDNMKHNLIISMQTNLSLRFYKKKDGKPKGLTTIKSPELNINLKTRSYLL